MILRMISTVCDDSNFALDSGFRIIILFFSIGTFVSCRSIFLFLTKQILDRLSMGLVDCHWDQISQNSRTQPELDDRVLHI